MTVIDDFLRYMENMLLFHELFIMLDLLMHLVPPVIIQIQLTTPVIDGDVFAL